MNDIFSNSNAYYQNVFPGSLVSDSTGILGEGLVQSGIAPVGTSSVIDPRVFSTQGLFGLASQDPLGAAFLASQQQLADEYLGLGNQYLLGVGNEYLGMGNEYFLGGGLEESLMFPNQVLSLLQGSGDPNLSFGSNYLLSFGF